MNLSGPEKDYSLQMKIKILSLLILILSLQGCSPLEYPSRKGTPIPLIPTLEPAVNFEKGISKVPKGYYIFIELRGSSVCSPECQCAPAPVRIQYNFTSSGELWTDLHDLPVILASSSPIVGFFGYGDWQDNLYVIEALPFKVRPDGDVTVYSIDVQGTAIVEVHGGTYFIRPGQSWTDSGDIKQEPPAGCHVSYSTRLSNYGLLSRTQIRFGDPSTH
jgi:hypothetical protein